MPVTKIKTVKIADPDLKTGYRIINEDDFDGETMSLYRRRRPPAAATVDEVAEAILRLPDDPSSRTASGLPQIAALEKLLPGKSISASVRDDAVSLLQSRGSDEDGEE